MNKNRVLVVVGLVMLAGAAGAADAQLLQTQTYQGRLESGGAAAVGTHQIRYRVFDASAGGTQLAEQIRTRTFGAADNGLFTFDDLDFGGAFGSGGDRWIETSAREGVAGAWTVLGPRQPVTAAPTAGVAARLALPYVDTAELPDSDVLRLTNTSAEVGSHAGHFVLGSPVTDWNSAAVIAESNTLFGIIGSGGPGAAGVAGVGRIDGAFGIRGEVQGGNKTGYAGLFLENNNFNDVYLGGASYAGIFNGDVYMAAGVDIIGEEIDSTEVLDEAGVASITSVSFVSLTPSFGAVVSRTITAPGPGYVIAIASAEVEVLHTNGVFSIVRYGVSDTMTATTGAERFSQLPSAAPSGAYSEGVSDQQVYPVAGGSQTFYFVARQSNGTGATMYDAQLTLIYVPTSYGSVTATGDGGASIARAGRNARRPLTPGEVAAERRAEEARAYEQMVRRQTEIDRLVAEQRSALAALRRTGVSE